MFQPDADGVYARVPVAASRRLLAVVLLYVLGALLLYLAFGSHAGILGAVIMVLLAAGSLWAGEQMRRVADYEILLTDEGVISADGEVLAELDNIAAVNRGALAAKPSTGFTLILKTPQPRGWRPGLWWRLGRRVGIGGITGAGAAKFMAEQIALRLSSSDDAP
ncbi:hypothetical protein AB3Y40_04185 [Yoonia sp. R2331]|uniref:hypothetical protein n=1 Tax=Yoonia sp. R2331 TaxID=3237238 RepID=UPI0034E6065B